MKIYNKKNKIKMRKIKKINELFFDHSEISSDEVRFYLFNPDTDKGFAMDIDRSDRENLIKIFDKNDIKYEVDDGANDLPF